MTCCAYTCTQYGFHTQYSYMLLTHADVLLCLQPHTAGFWSHRPPPPVLKFYLACRCQCPTLPQPFLKSLIEHYCLNAQHKFWIWFCIAYHVQIELPCNSSLCTCVGSVWRGGWVIAVVMLGGFVSVGSAGYRSLKIDPFTSPCTADRTENGK